MLPNSSSASRLWLMQARSLEDSVAEAKTIDLRLAPSSSRRCRSSQFLPFFIFACADMRLSLGQSLCIGFFVTNCFLVFLLLT
mmetsp:Transcript_58030/g.123271  ORF Transcript_58030/g.123271 Transcript_58030/m.123271 type:complete len:83 (-) Transcript_58030:1-249(-)